MQVYRGGQGSGRRGRWRLAAIAGVAAALAWWLVPPAGAPGGPPGGAAVDTARSTASAPAPAATPAAPVASARTAAVPASGPSAVRSAAVPEQIEEPGDVACALFLHRLPGVSQRLCQSARLAPSGAVSQEGVPLYWRDIETPAFGGDRASPLRVLVVGAIHGDELTSASLALHWLALAAAPPDGAAARAAATPQRAVHWRFIPVLNPDGLLARSPTRVNARGVDLNRNFPTPHWERDAPIYWEKRARKDPRRWPGHTPLSEPESHFLHAQMDRFEPHLVVSIHAPYGVLDFDGPHDPPQRLGRLRLDQVGVFPGSLGHYGGLHRGVPVVTIELQHALKMPPDAEIRSMWKDLVSWMDTRLPLPDASAVRAQPRTAGTPR